MTVWLYNLMCFLGQLKYQGRKYRFSRKLYLLFLFETILYIAYYIGMYVTIFLPHNIRFYLSHTEDSSLGNCYESIETMYRKGRSMF